MLCYIIFLSIVILGYTMIYYSYFMLLYYAVWYIYIYIWLYALRYSTRIDCTVEKRPSFHHIILLPVTQAHHTVLFLKANPLDEEALALLPTLRDLRPFWELHGQLLLPLNPAMLPCLLSGIKTWTWALLWLDFRRSADEIVSIHGVEGLSNNKPWVHEPFLKQSPGLFMFADPVFQAGPPWRKGWVFAGGFRFLSVLRCLWRLLSKSWPRGTARCHGAYAVSAW